MKHITLRVLLPLMVMALITGCVGIKSGADKGQTLTAPPAPFAAQKVLQAMPEIKELNTMKPSAGGCGFVPVKQYGVFCGDNSLTLLQDNLLAFNLTIGGQNAGGFSYWGGTKHGSGHPFKGADPTASLGKDAKSITIKKSFFAGSETNADGEFTEQIKLLENGLVDIKYGYSLPEGAKATDQGLFFNFYPFKIVEGKKLLIDGKPYSFSQENDPYGKRKVYAGSVGSIVFNPDRPERSFSLIFPVKTHLEINETREEKDKGNVHKYCASIRISAGNAGELNFQLDMRNTSEDSLKSADTFAGINFWQSDRLHIPDYGKCRNLIQNPSFEAGLRYYAYPSVGGYLKTEFDQLALTDSQQSKFGHASLLMRAFTNCSVSLQTFAIPVSAGKKYTVSLYAKGDKPHLRLDLSGISGEWMVFPKMGSCGPTAEWKRYSFSFTAPNNAISVEMSGSCGGKEDRAFGNIWIDGLQVEEGDQATEYVEKPLSSILLTSDPDNFLSVDDKKIDARLKITAPANTTGKVTCGIEDFFYRKIWEQGFDFKTDAKGLAVVNLPIENLLGKGLYVVRADYELSNGYKDTDYYRISRMEFLKNTHKNKDIFATYKEWTRYSRGRDLLKRMRDVGFGSVNYGPRNLNKEYFDGIAEYGVSFNDEEMLSGKPVIEGFRAIESVSPELEKKLEDACYEKAKAYPWVNSWNLCSELEHIALVKKNNFKDFAKLEIAFYKGVKRFDPNKKAYLGGSCNMEPQNGTYYVDKYLEAVNGAVKFDGVTIHPYRTTPEHPDLDDDAAVFFAMLDKHGYKGAPVYWDEGIYYTCYNIPA